MAYCKAAAGQLRDQLTSSCCIPCPATMPTCPAVAAQALAQQQRELGISVRHMPAAFRQLVDHLQCSG